MYKTGETAKAKEISLRNLTFIKEHLHYYTANKMIGNLANERNVRLALAGLQRFQLINEQHKDADVKKVVDEMMNQYGYFFGE